ncbi:hypothetical protein BDQ17DRAFT_1348782 [Cyathus striatus]|nr:hypothetical protein BDQ17DRAFT_1348782 [Cyathus striatus]
MAPGKSRSLRALAFGRRHTSPGPPSPTFSDATHASAMNFGADGPAKIITRTDLKFSLQAYEDLMDSCANYRAALVSMSTATASFADAMEKCSGLKGPSYEAGTRLQAASGVHHLIGNLWHVLSETLDKSFEKPLRQHLETYRTIVNERSASYERTLREKSQVIRETEMRNMNRKQRNLQSFREALAVLQQQVDDLDDLKASHYQEIMEHEEEVWDVVQGKVCVVVRSSMDVFDRITAKASDPVIEPMLQSVPDPFDSYGPPPAEDQIFSILAPLSIMSNAPSSSPTPMTATPERDILQPLPSSATKIASWLPTTNTTLFSSESTEWANAMPPSSSSASPHSTSPSQMNRRHSVPPGRKAESKLRSVLSVIGESRKLENEDANSNRSPLVSSNGVINLQSESNPESAWSPFSHRTPYDNNDTDDDTTPQHSILYSQIQSSPHESAPTTDSET